MQRKTAFAPGEHYHLFSRGVEKRKIFETGQDYDRFIVLLYILNQHASFHIGNFLHDTRKTLQDIFSEKREESLVSILAYSLMPNHFHILVYEKEEGGISKFMGKVLTAYSMYFNKKYDRTGPLFVHPFRSAHVSRDEHFLHLFSYIHLNPLDLFEPHWKIAGIKNFSKATRVLAEYPYSSYTDFLSKREAIGKIIDFAAVPDYISRTTLDIEGYQKWYTDFTE